MKEHHFRPGISDYAKSEFVIYLGVILFVSLRRHTLVKESANTYLATNPVPLVLMIPLLLGRRKDIFGAPFCSDQLARYSCFFSLLLFMDQPATRAYASY
jgi:hypothetical protein